MNQIIPVGKGILIATDQPVSRAGHEHMTSVWRGIFPDIPMVLIEGRIALLPNTGLAMFEFTGEVSPTVVAEFQRWWEEVNRG